MLLNVTVSESGNAAAKERNNYEYGQEEKQGGDRGDRVLRLKHCRAVEKRKEKPAIDINSELKASTKCEGKHGTEGKRVSKEYPQFCWQLSWRFKMQLKLFILVFKYAVPIEYS